MIDYNDYPIIVGGYGFEVEHFNGEFWDRKPDVPGYQGDFNYREYIEYHSLVTFLDTLYLFGGR